MAKQTTSKSNVVQLAPTSLQQKLAKARETMYTTLIERDEEIDLSFVGLIAGENVLLVGPPGTGKSLLSESLCSFIDGHLFSYLLTKYSTPDELFGPLAITKLQQDQYERVIDGYLPTADILFLDEIFKASSAILNTLLRVLNERRFRNNTSTITVPMLSCIAASNEWPNEQEGGKELGALFDRFVIRKHVHPIRTPAGRRRLLWDANLIPQFADTITPVEVLQARAEAKALNWERQAMEAMETMLADLARNDGIMVGDRRQRKAVAVAQANAYLTGATVVEPEHLEILGHVFWTDPVEQPKKAIERVSKIANPVGAEVTKLLGEAQEQLDKIPHDTTDLQAFGSAAKKLGEIVKKLQALKETDKTRVAIKRLTNDLEELKSRAFKHMNL